MKIISFSLWGADPKYTQGALENARLALQLFPEWTCAFHTFACVPSEVGVALANMPNCIVTHSPGRGDNRGMFARFETAAAPGAECVIFRDTDSRLSKRERLAVDEWLAGGEDLHVMRDHPWHGTAILGGMWGVLGGRLPEISRAVEPYMVDDRKGEDQRFLAGYVWPMVSAGKLTVKVHDPFFDRKPFPPGSARSLNGQVQFIGQVFSADGSTAAGDLAQLLLDPKHVE